MNTFTITSQKNTFVTGIKPSLAPCKSPTLKAGNCGFHKYLSYIYFDLSSLPANQIISSSVLTLHFFSPPYQGKPPRFLKIYPLAEEFEDCLTSYATRPGLEHFLQKKICIPSSYNLITLDLTTLVKKWYAGALINYGLSLVPDQLFGQGLLLFHSSFSPDTSTLPTLIINSTGPSQVCITNNMEETHQVYITEGFSRIFEVWCCSVYSFIIKNTGSIQVLVNIQDSPDGINFIDEEPEYELYPGESKILVNRYFARYSRIKFLLSSGEQGPGEIKIWLQSRSNT